jgi:hypothetical protein
MNSLLWINPGPRGSSIPQPSLRPGGELLRAARMGRDGLNLLRWLLLSQSSGWRIAAIGSHGDPPLQARMIGL